MQPRRAPLAVAGAIALATVGFVSTGPAGATAAAATQSASATHGAPTANHAVAPRPAIAGNQLQQTLSSPPTTAQCERLYRIACYSPVQYRQAYNANPLYARGITGKGRTIAIVDSFGSPTIANDLHVFDSAYGLADPPSLKVIAPAGPIPAFDPHNADHVGWAQETTLDVEYAHAMAPDANILLVETPVAETEGVTGFPEIVKAENYVVDHHLADVISQSFGATEQTFPTQQSLLDLRSAFENAAAHGVTVLGASGDSGATSQNAAGTGVYPYPVNSWPSSDPLVTSIGGTMLHLDANGNRTAPDEVWNDGYGAGGGGLSTVFDRPNFQNQVKDVVGTHRGTPDISMSAAVNGAAVYYYSFVPGRVGYHLVGGTSEACPLFSGVIALAAQVADGSLGNINKGLYKLGQHGSSSLVDVTTGNNSFAGVTGYPATPGYDLASGWGTVDVTEFVPAIARAAHNGD